MGSGGALSLGETNEPTFKHKYTRTASGLYDHFSAVTSSGSTCYITFDWLGAQLTTCSESPLGGTDAENAKLQIRFP